MQAQKTNGQNTIKESIQNRLLELQDIEYRNFNSRLIPTINSDTMIGVRTPALRKLAKELFKMPEISGYLEDLPHQYYEENNLHAFLIEMIKDYDECVTAVNKFLPYVDNWATCDCMSPKVFKKHTSELPKQIRVWIDSDSTYTIRFGVGMLMRFYLDDDFDIEYPELVANISSQEYYVNMMRAWYFATALGKQYSKVFHYIEEKRLDRWTHNKVIQKAAESYRITDEQKKYLKQYKY